MKRRRFLTAVVLLGITTMLLARAMAGVAPVDSSIAVHATNQLGLDLYAQCCRANGDANLLLSPCSIQTALAMTYAGADGETRAEMQRVLHYPQDEILLHRSFQTLWSVFNREIDTSRAELVRMVASGGRLEPLELSFANRLFGQQGYGFQGSFLNRTKDFYAAPFLTVDFAHQPEQAAASINNWIAQETHQKIKDVIPKGLLTTKTRLALVNALHFKAAWCVPFTNALTRNRPFQVRGTETQSVSTMELVSQFGYRKCDGFSAIALPYGNCGFQFLILLPDEARGLAAVEARITPEILNECKRISYRPVSLQMPKFKLEPEAMLLGKMLQTLGMKLAFDLPEKSADFGRIAPRKSDDYLFLSEVLHKTFIVVNEKGTEAGAVTAMTAGAAGEPEKPIEIHVDRPFLFVVQHRKTGACLFLGRITDPR